MSHVVCKIYFLLSKSRQLVGFSTLFCDNNDPVNLLLIILLSGFSTSWVLKEKIILIILLFISNVDHLPVVDFMQRSLVIRWRLDNSLYQLHQYVMRAQNCRNLSRENTSATHVMVKATACSTSRIISYLSSATSIFICFVIVSPHFFLSNQPNCTPWL